MQGLFLYTYVDIVRQRNVVISEFWAIWSEFWIFWSEFLIFWSEFWTIWSEFWSCRFEFWGNQIQNWRNNSDFLVVRFLLCPFIVAIEFMQILKNGYQTMKICNALRKCRKIWVLRFLDLSFEEIIWVMEKLAEFLESPVIWVLASVYKKTPWISP